MHYTAQVDTLFCFDIIETLASALILCTMLLSILTEEVDYIQNEMTTKSRQAAVDTFIQKLEKNKHQPGTFTAVVQALENSSNYACSSYQYWAYR